MTFRAKRSSIISCPAKFKILSLLWAVCIPNICFSESVSALDTLELAIARMKPEAAAKIHYQETRYLELLDKPWQGSGHLFAQIPDKMIKEQRYPQREIMGINGTKMYYFDPFKQRRHQGELQHDKRASFHLLAFLAIINGDLQILRDNFQLQFAAGKAHWKLLLTTKVLTDENNERIEISGLLGKGAERITVFMEDNERTEYRLNKIAEGVQLNKKITQLFTELKGD